MADLGFDAELTWLLVIDLYNDFISEEANSGIASRMLRKRMTGFLICRSISTSRSIPICSTTPMIRTSCDRAGTDHLKIYIGYWFFGRPTVEEHRQDLRAVINKYRPDWDITSPEMKRACEQGRKLWSACQCERYTASDGREPDAVPTRVPQPDLGGRSDVEDDRTLLGAESTVTSAEKPWAGEAQMCAQSSTQSWPSLRKMGNACDQSPELGKPRHTSIYAGHCIALVVNGDEQFLRVSAAISDLHRIHCSVLATGDVAAPGKPARGSGARGSLAAA